MNKRNFASVVIGITALIGCSKHPKAIHPTVIGKPTSWTISYLTPDNQQIVKTVAAPVANNFVEDRAVGAISIEMTLPQCLAYKQYRFWVGPYGSDSTSRQPTEWSLYVRGTDGGWVKADSEKVGATYANDRWYSFPLHSATPCIRQVRMNITKVVDGNLFRLYGFQVYN